MRADEQQIGESGIFDRVRRQDALHQVICFVGALERVFEVRGEHAIPSKAREHIELEIGVR